MFQKGPAQRLISEQVASHKFALYTGGCHHNVHGKYKFLKKSSNNCWGPSDFCLLLSLKASSHVVVDFNFLEPSWKSGKKVRRRNWGYSLAPANGSIFLGNRWQKRDQVSMKPVSSPLYRPRPVSSVQTESGGFREIGVSADVNWATAKHGNYCV